MIIKYTDIRLFMMRLRTVSYYFYLTTLVDLSTFWYCESEVSGLVHIWAAILQSYVAH